MTTKNIKIALFGGLLMAMILPFALMDISASSTETVRDNSIKGKLFITDDNDKKQLTKADFEELERTAVKMTDSETKAMRSNIDSVSEKVRSLAESENIWITEIGTDHNTKSLKISIERSGISEEKHATIEKKLREIVGNDVDITINYDDPLFFGCSQTGDCEPIEGGTRISVGGELCSMGYRATYGGATGFVTAGHCAGVLSTDDSVGNPSSFWWDDLGEVTDNSFEDGTWCDCAFVENDESTSSDVFDGQTVSGTLFPVLYDWLEFEGTVTQGSQGGITDTYEHIYPKFTQNGPTYEIKVVVTGATTAGGDSGGSVIESTTGTPKFAGTIITDDGHYTPYHRITTAFSGLTLG